MLLIFADSETIVAGLIEGERISKHAVFLVYRICTVNVVLNFLEHSGLRVDFLLPVIDLESINYQNSLLLNAVSVGLQNIELFKYSCGLAIELELLSYLSAIVHEFINLQF